MTPSGYESTDLFCGAGGSGIGAAAAGLRLVIAANHSALAIETHSANFPGTEHDCADISQVDPRRYRRTTFLWGSPECFPAGSLVTTASGQTPIEDVALGDLVLTHQGRWRPVVRTQHQTAATVIVQGQGHNGLEITPNHRLWARAGGRQWDKSIRHNRRRWSDPAWTPAAGLLETQACWATPWRSAPLPVSEPPPVFGLDLAAAWWLVGRWLGDGSLSFGRNHEVVLVCGKHEADVVRERLADTGYCWGESWKRTAVVFYLGDEKARDWLGGHFGHGAANKGLPSFALTMPCAHRQALLDGYLSADGGFTQRRVRCSTVSRRLAVSVRMLAESLGHRVAMAQDKRTAYNIEGRTGAARTQWILHWEPTLNPKRSPEAFTDEIHAWSRVRSVRPGREEVTVYNIEVEEDHSYVLDGIVVANCTNHSGAKGTKRTPQRDLFSEPDPVAERSRATMWDIPRFAEYHRYEFVIVENVVEVASWEMWPAWLHAMRCLGYSHRVVSLNSMHAPGENAPRAPQSRDRVYVVFWGKGVPAPDLDLRPPAYCGGCEVDVPAVQWWKPQRSIGRYRAQYLYRCPTCHQVVEPYVLPAAAAIDWTIPGQRIGDRARPLRPATLARIQAGLDRYAGTAQLVPAGGTWNGESSPVTDPMRSRTTRESEGLLVPVEGRDRVSAAPSWAPMRTRTTRHQTALVVPYYRTGLARAADEPLPTVSTHDRCGVAFIAELRGGHSTCRAVTDPLATVTASGTHHMLVRNNGTRGSRDGMMCTPVTEPARTITTAGHQSLVGWEQPIPEVEDCTFRMLQVPEISAAMAFTPTYVIKGNKRQQVAQLGNAVTPPASEWLYRQCIAALERSA